MTANQFAVLCGIYCIDPHVALENEELREALKARDDKKVERILKTQF